MPDSRAPHIVGTAQRKETAPLEKSINPQRNLFCRQDGNVLNHQDSCKIWLCLGILRTRI